MIKRLSLVAIVGMSLAINAAAFAQQQSAVSNRATAYVCSEHRCLPPTTDPDVMLTMLQTDKHP